MTINYFFDQPLKSKQKTYAKLVEMSENEEYTAESVLVYLYHQNYYERIGIDLSRQTNTIILQQINFMKKVEEE